jgi:hypothetical protein
MRRPRLPLTIVVLVAAFAVSLAPTLMNAQEDMEGGGEGISFKPLEESQTEGGGKKTLQSYLFTFESDAALPEYPYPEVMVVKVASGRFAIRVGNEDLVIVDPQGKPIWITTVTEENLVSGEENDVVRNGDGSECTTLCALPPDVTVLIEQDMTVYLPGDTTCFFCNMTDDDAELLVYPAVPRGEAFSWTQLQKIQSHQGDGPRYYRSAEIPSLEHLSHWLLREREAGVGEEGGGILGGDGRNAVVSGHQQRVVGAGFGPPQRRFEFRERLLDRVQVRGIGR